jgi:hypothetical protein
VGDDGNRKTVARALSGCASDCITRWVDDKSHRLGAVWIMAKTDLENLAIST